MDAGASRLVNWPASIGMVFSMRLLPVLFLCTLLVPAARADVPADQLERARLLRELLEAPAPATPKSEGSALPGAKLDARIQANREQLQMQQFDDGQWRRLLGEQQAGKIRQEMTGVPSAAASARALGFERDQRMRDLSTRIQQQDLQFRSNNRR